VTGGRREEAEERRLETVAVHSVKELTVYP
jgi:hypothetical protein